ncbi:LIM domain-binding protein 2 isoform X5 [Strongylocentrotus purpuratus]|uniref:LIM interaction domain-containing protein n=1 Tax=Strongylocentrotus purpuratus TaxID=7668 RepID=A0A7M7NVF4_STRPU|nr:LIM domain-binding protein 2 isoform X5 [Strongylocentrotus purpuratus]
MPAPGMPVPMDGRDHGYVPRHTPFISQPDYRIYDLNKRLQQRTEESDNLWWDAFATEFFEDDATLTLCFCLEDGPKRYTIGRTLIPRYFRTVFEGGVTDLYYLLKHPKESFHNTTITLDCEQTTMVTHHGKPMFTKVCTEGRLVVEFTFDDLMRIRSWYFDIRQHRELIPRSVINIQYHSQDPTMLEQLSKNITRQGLTSCTLNYLRLCVILEPMQELMSRHKVYSLSPRDCLKATLFQKWQRIVTPPDTNRPQQKRRKRKSSTTLSTTGGNNLGMNNIGGGNSKKKSPGSFSSDGMPTDVMVVGEPSLMGGEFGDEDERLITRLENQQADANNGMDNDEDFAGGESGGTGPGPGGPKSTNSSSGPGGQGSWNSTDTKPPPGTNPPQDEKQVAASQN